MPSSLSTVISHRETKIQSWGILNMNLLYVHFRACYKARTLRGKSISGKDEPEEGQVYKLTGRRTEYQSMSQAEAEPWPVQALLGPAQVPSRPEPSLLPETFSLREPPALPQSVVPLQVSSALFLSALLLLAVKTETFYGVYKPEVTQLNETICHIKFTSARIKRQIT